MEPATLLSSLLKASRDQISCELEGETVILRAGVYYGLNSPGTHVWNLLQQPIAFPQIRDALLQKYEVDADRCERDLVNLLQGLVDAGLIEVPHGTHC